MTPMTHSFCVHSGAGPEDQPSFHRLEPSICSGLGSRADCSPVCLSRGGGGGETHLFLLLQDGLMLSLCCIRGLRWWEAQSKEDRGRNDPIRRSPRARGSHNQAASSQFTTCLPHGRFWGQRWLGHQPLRELMVREKRQSQEARDVAC